MKKLLALLLAIMCVFCFVGCSNEAGEESGKGNGSKSDAEAAKAALTGFLDGFCKLDAEEMEKYIDDPSAIPEEFNELNIDNLMDQMPAELEPYSDDFEKLLNAMVDRMSKEITYEITDEKEDDGEYTYTVSITAPNFDDVDMEEVFADAFTEDVMLEIVEELQASGKITDASSEEEIMDAVMPEIIDKAIETIDDMDFDTVTEDNTFVVCEKDGEWLVNAEKSDLE